MGSIKEAGCIAVGEPEEVSLLPPQLAQRDQSQRFNPFEKALLAQAMSDAWPKSSEFSRGKAEWMIMENGGNYRWGIYPDGERFVHKREDGVIDNLSHDLLYVVAYLETTDDITVVRTAWDKVGARIIVGSTNFPHARGDRPVQLGDGWTEMVLLKIMLKDMYRDGVRGLVLVDSHSPALSWYALREKIGVLDLSAIPLMLMTANNEGLFSQGDWRVVVGRQLLAEIGLCHAPWQVYNRLS